MEIIKLTVKRHCVGQLPESGLSPLQHELLNNSTKIRIANAPTGAGKSYAFERAMLDNKQRILFIVPTRRLCQNLATGLLNSLAHMHGWTKEHALSKISIWNSDETKKLREAGEPRIMARRVREITDLNDAMEGGEMVIAVPEVVSSLLLRSYPEKGLSDKGVFDLLTGFDHIVFDEFHTISPRGFGLAGLFAKLATKLQGSRARVSFLSATPLDIAPVLHRLDIPEDQIITLEEKLTSKGRWVHGDVCMIFCQTESMVSLLRKNVEVIKRERERHRQVVIIYNKLIDLQEDLPELKQIFIDAGTTSGQALLINSIDDSRSGNDNDDFFVSGRDHDPKNFEILVATASVEMGVTFRADVLFMEPGFEPMNFLQRYGRAARGNHDGQVFIRWDDEFAGKQPWFRRFHKWISTHQNQMVGIDDITEILSRSARRKFKDCPENGQKHFGKMPNRAAYAAGLYWNVLMKHFSNSGHRWKYLKEFQPKPASHVYSLLKQVREMNSDRNFGDTAKSWCDQFEQEAHTLRNIARGIRLVERDGKGNVFRASEQWVLRNTDILKRFPLLLAEDGEEEIRISGTLSQHFLTEKNYIKATKNASFPHMPYPVILNDDIFLVDSWCREFAKKEGPDALAWTLYPEAMNAALTLVRLTGLIVSADTECASTIGVL
ncbi:DEAD/DEAH box helicase [Desulfocicer niacini]